MISFFLSIFTACLTIILNIMSKVSYSDFAVSVSKRLYSALTLYSGSAHSDELRCLDRNFEFYSSIPDIDITVSFIHKGDSGVVPRVIPTTLRHFYCACFKISSFYTVDNFDSFFNVVLYLSGCTHFSYNEFVNSSVASIIGCPNDPFGPKGRFLFCNYIVFSHILERVRSILGRPVLITSGYRCSRLNSAVGGAKKSYHTRYRAVDIAVNESEAALLEPLLVARLKAKEFIVGHKYLHIAF